LGGHDRQETVKIPKQSDALAWQPYLIKALNMASRNRKDYKPLVMWLILFSGIIAVTVVRSSRAIGVWRKGAFNWDTVFIGLYVLWMVIELRVTRKDISTEGKKTSDFATCQLYGAGQALTFLTALWFPSVWEFPNAAHLFGLSVFILGACYRLWAIRTLGPFYSHRVQTMTRHEIVDTGPYQFTRHPAYAGMIVANAGISTYFFNWVTACVFLFFLLPAIFIRIVIEERTLFGIEGYAEFAKPRKRLFPAIW
jgi:protein-S-isoprenylcysteine O-methyltransferase Ste14